MTITKALITAANPADKHLPLQTIVDSNGETKTALAILLEELLDANITTIAIVIAPGEASNFKQAAGQHASQLTFIEQLEPLGYGHAVASAADFIDNESFLLLVGDHLFRSFSQKSCIQQLLDLAEKEDATISGVQPTHEAHLQLYGTVAAQLIPGSKGIYDVSSIIEKPTPTLAEQELIVPGLRAGYYLCFFGMHALPGSAMGHLHDRLNNLPLGEKMGLTPTLNHLASSGKYLALQIDGQRYNLGERYGLLRAQLALGLAGPHRDEVMATLIELLATDR
ncbi:MAG: sugar phosphate nucleotidyltransferase [Verrucomicrobiota bacterium]